MITNKQDKDNWFERNIYSPIVHTLKKINVKPYDIEAYYNVDELSELLVKYITLIPKNSDAYFMAGEFTPTVYDREEIRNAFKNAKDKNIKFTFIGGPDTPQGSKFINSFNNQKDVKLLIMRNRPNTHYRVFDSRFVSIEEPHESNQFKRTGYFIDSPSMAREVQIGLNELILIINKSDRELKKMLANERGC